MYTNSLERTTAVACGIAPNQLLVGAQPVAPSSQFVEGGLLVALVEIAQMIGGKILNKRQFSGICRVECVVGQADAQCVVVQMLFAPGSGTGLSSLSDEHEVNTLVPQMRVAASTHCIKFFIICFIIF